MERWIPLLAWMCAGAAGAEPLGPAAAAAWDADLAFMAERFIPCDQSLDEAGRAAVAEAVAALRLEAPALSEPEVLAAIARIGAVTANRASGPDILAHPAMASQLPIRFAWFDEGAYIVRAAPGHEAILLGRIRTIAGIAAERLQDEIAALIPGNASWKRYMGPAYMTRPAVLAGLGLVEPGAPVPVVCDTIDGGQIDALLDPIPASSAAEPWTDLSPVYADPAQKWLKAVDAPPLLLPLPLQRPQENYWLHYFAEARALYINYSRCAERPGDPISAFAAKVVRAVADHEPRRVIVDLRYNAGGSHDLGHRLMVRLVNTPAFAAPGGTVVLTGPATAGAAVYHAAYLKQMAAAVVIGQPAGDDLAYRPAAHTVTLPHSQLVFRCAGALRDYRLGGGAPRSNALAVASIGPDVPIGASWIDYLACRDPALDAALAYVPSND